MGLAAILSEAAMMPPLYDPAAWQAHADTDLLRQEYENVGWAGYRLRNRLAIEDALESGCETVLDIGCFVGMYAEIVHRRAHYCGVDVTPKYIAAATVARPLCEFHVADARDMPFADRQFDLAFCFGLLIHLDDPCAVIREAWRVTAKTLILEATTHPGDERLYLGNSIPQFLHVVYPQEALAEVIRSTCGCEPALQVAPTYGGFESTLWVVNRTR